MTDDAEGRRHAVSVVLAARDAAAFLEETLASLDAQTHPAFELVAVDDGSTDATGAILQAHAARSVRPDRPVRVVHAEPRGLAAARNRGVAEARGGLLVVLDGDDVLEPTLIEKARRHLVERDDLDVIYPLFEHVGLDGTPLGVRTAPPRRPLTPVDLLMSNPIHSDSGVVVRRSAFEAAGGFDEELSGYVGLDFWRRVLSLRPANALCLPEPLVLYRRHPRQITSSTQRMQQNFPKVIAKFGVDDPRFPPAMRRRTLAAQRLYWSSVAYAGNDLPEARLHAVGAWRLDPARMAITPDAYARALIALASLLPARLHEPLRRLGPEMLARWTPSMARRGGRRPRPIRATARRGVGE